MYLTNLILIVLDTFWLIMSMAKKVDLTLYHQYHCDNPDYLETCTLI